MSTHQFNEQMQPDNLFTLEGLKCLSVRNECRLLDKRRTPGFIKSIDMDAGFFRWEISDFEDKGHFWDVEFERVDNYQFRNNSKELNSSEVEILSKRIVALNKFIEVKATEAVRHQTNESIKLAAVEALNWLDCNSEFFLQTPPVDFQSLIGPALLRKDFNRFMSEFGLSDFELQTANIQVVNPSSGDWVKAMQIVMAEMGLKNYAGQDLRTKKVFDGIGNLENRKKYIRYRLAFLRAMFGKLGVKEVELYRAMSTEWNWKTDDSKQNRYWSSWTFNYKVAQDFADLSPATKYKNSYLLKRAIPVESLFMTFLETDAMNRQYKEAEAIILHEDQDRFLW